MFRSTGSPRQSVADHQLRHYERGASLQSAPAVAAAPAGTVRSSAGERRIGTESFAGSSFLRIETARFGGLSRTAKTVLDRVLAALAIVVLSPLFAALALAIRLTSEGPTFYRQVRIGRDGRPFRIIKFRSMFLGADSMLDELAARNECADGLLFKMKADPRVTPVGRVLRRFSLDELPQLVNVVTGSMSLVGPRPPLPSEVAQYRSDMRRRLSVKPGLTGLWQVSGRSDLSWEESVRLDLHYVDNWSFGLDLALLWRTFRVVLRAEGAY